MTTAGLITTHVLDTSTGFPAAGIEVTLERVPPTGGAELISTRTTDNDGRVRDLVDQPLDPGTFRLTFKTREYFARRNIAAFYPIVRVEFTITDTARHHHVPLLLTPFGYSTYRGS